MPLFLLQIFLASLAAGIAASLAFAPWEYRLLWPVLLAIPTGIVLLVRTPLAGFLAGFGFGLGLFGAGVSWVRAAFDAYGAADPWLANGLTALLILTLALIPAGTLALGGSLLRRRPPGLRDGALLAVLWLASEWLRSRLGGGFPWLLGGLTQTGGSLATLLPLGGVSLVSLVLAWIAALPGLYRLRTPGWQATTLLALVVWTAIALMPRIEWTHPMGAPLQVALVQPDVAQAHKWDPAHRLDILDDLMEKIESRLGHRLIVLPETALPDYQTELRDMLEAIDAEARAADSTVLLGIPWHAGGRVFHNAALLLGQNGGSYFKRRLVPLGEYTPWSGLWPELPNPLKRRLPDFVPGPLHAEPLALGQTQKLSVTICFEDAFPELWRREAAKASLLVNLSNDGWFRSAVASAQHLQISRARALEQQKPLIRATNTGISALVRPDGSLAAALEQGAGVLEGTITGRTGATPYARLGDGPVLLLSLLFVAVYLRSGRYGTSIAKHPMTT